MSSGTALSLIVAKFIGFGLIGMYFFSLATQNTNNDFVIFGLLILIYTDVVMIRIEAYKEHYKKD